MVSARKVFLVKVELVVRVVWGVGGHSCGLHGYGVCVSFVVQVVRVQGRRRLPVRPTSNNSVKQAGELLISMKEQSTGLFREGPTMRHNEARSLWRNVGETQTHDICTETKGGPAGDEHEVPSNTQPPSKAGRKCGVEASLIESGEDGGDAIDRFIEKKDPRSLKLVHLSFINITAWRGRE